MAIILDKTPPEHRPVVENYFTENEHFMNEHAFQCLTVYTKGPYKDLDSYLKLMLPSTYVAWFCYRYDPDFLRKFAEILNSDDPKISELLQKDELFNVAYNTLKKDLET